MNDDEQPELLLQGFTYSERATLLPSLGRGIDSAGGWLLHRQPASATSVEVHLELQHRALPDLYAALLASGVELTRESHRALAQRCNCSLHLPPMRGSASILSLRIEVHFLGEPGRTGEAPWLTLRNAATA